MDHPHSCTELVPYRPIVHRTDCRPERGRLWERFLAIWSAGPVGLPAGNALPAVRVLLFFGAMGAAAQLCTSTSHGIATATRCELAAAAQQDVREAPAEASRSEGSGQGLPAWPIVMPSEPAAWFSKLAARHGVGIASITVDLSSTPFPTPSGSSARLWEAGLKVKGSADVHQLRQLLAALASAPCLVHVPDLELGFPDGPSPAAFEMRVKLLGGDASLGSSSTCVNPGVPATDESRETGVHRSRVAATPISAAGDSSGP